MNHLPDLPTAGYATDTQKAVSDVMMMLIRQFERDRLLLLETVIQGKRLWRKRFVKEYRFIKADAEAADAVFGYFELLAGPNPSAQKAILEQHYAQQQRQSYDKRLSTALKLREDARLLREAIQREHQQPRRSYSI